MSKGIFQESKIIYLSLEQASKLHPIWKGRSLDIPLDAISPNELIELLGMDAEDEWLEWLTISHPIVLVEKQRKRSESIDEGEDEPKYYRIMGHDTFHYLVRYIGEKYGLEKLKKQSFPMTVISQKKLSNLQNTIFNNELVFSYLLQKSKKHRELMQAHLFSSPPPIEQIQNHRQLSKFSKISHSSICATAAKTDVSDE